MSAGGQGLVQEGLFDEADSYPGLSAGELRAELGAFRPPQGYVRLSQHPRMLAVCEKVAAAIPIREMPVHHP